MATRSRLLWQTVTGLVIVLLAFSTLVDRSKGNDRGLRPALPDPEQLQSTTGERVADAASAAEDSGHVVFSAASAFPQSLKGTWVNDIGRVTEIYSNGLTVVSEVPEYGDDELAYYEAVVKDADRDSVYITEINGLKALAVEPNTDKLASNPGLIRFEASGVSVVISGEGMSVEKLTAVEKALQPVVSSSAERPS